MKFALVLSKSDGTDIYQYNRKLLEESIKTFEWTKEEYAEALLNFAKEARVGDTFPFRDGIIFAIADNAQTVRPR